MNNKSVKRRRGKSDKRSERERDMDVKKEIEEKGYAVIRDVLDDDEIKKAKTMFEGWIDNMENIKEFHKKINPHGIFKYHEAGHQEHAWYIRTRPKVQQIFKEIYETDELISSYDGCCWINPEMFNKKRDTCWIHVDQNPINANFECLQGLVSLTNNKTTTLVVYEESQKLFSYLKNILKKLE